MHFCCPVPVDLADGPGVHPEHCRPQRAAHAVEADEGLALVGDAQGPDRRDVDGLDDDRTPAAVAAHQSSAFCSPQPGRCWTSSKAVRAWATECPSALHTTALAAVVEQSTPIT